MTTFVTIIFIIVALMMILSILLQAGKGGGLGTALGGGASQGVFGSGGGADFMSKLTQGFAATFMISAMYLAYASAHAGSDFLESSDEGAAEQLDSDEEIDYERLGPRPQPLPTPEEGKALQAKAAALVPPLSEAPPEALEPVSPAMPPATPTPVTPTPVAPSEPATPDTQGGDSPDAERGDSAPGGKSGQSDSVQDDESARDDEPAEEP
jgi:preprotein translocase subunit SecG